VTAGAATKVALNRQPNSIRELMNLIFVSPSIPHGKPLLPVNHGLLTTHSTRSHARLFIIRVDRGRAEQLAFLLVDSSRPGLSRRAVRVAGVSRDE
jgi:hypothetical protein